MTPRPVSVLGLTGSIGTTAAGILRRYPDRFRVVAASCGQRIEAFAPLVREFQPELVAVEDDQGALRLASLLSDLPHPPRIEIGMPGQVACATHPDAAIVLNALVGGRGLYATAAALRSGKQVALANKESLVVGGTVLLREGSAGGGHLIPVDSEHSAIFQCLQGPEAGRQIQRLILTASGGPMRTWSADRIQQATIAEALNHPTWQMGPKITIDSATLMNKGLEVIEATLLFGVPVDQVEVVIHPQSIIHSLVEFTDGSVLAQLGYPSMELPIQYALTWPERLPSTLRPLDLADLAQLTFEAPDEERFPCLRLAREAAARGGFAPAVLNGANEAAVAQFLAGEIPFGQIAVRIEAALRDAPTAEPGSVEALIAAHEAAMGLPVS
ncbi:MAG: 1-deoxy-D-xylulose 5-phosphate reductoisomerase [bacterium]|nr:1-deoxy-D-xylulose 5-phosphate reductoisomerase [bacterium]